jgi:hypothetical protein
VAWAASDALHVTAAALGSRILRQAADAYDRAARQPHAQIPEPSPAGNRLRHAARIMSAYAYLTRDRNLIPLILITRLAALAEAVADLREAQHRAAQANAARTAAERLHAAARPAARTAQSPGTRTAAHLAADSFPGPPAPARPAQPAPGQQGAEQAAPCRARRPGPPRPRGPTR